MAQCVGINSCIEVNDLKMYFMLRNGLFSEPEVLKAMNGVSFSIKKNHTMGLVGESGCGKTAMGRTVLKLYQATTSRVLYQGMDITGLSSGQMVPYRKKMRMILQDPYTSSDPRKSIGDIITESIWTMRLHTGKGKNDRVRKLTEMVGLKPDHINQYPHEFSGGQKQKIDITRTLVAESEFIMRDEPVSALDVSVQVQIISVLGEPQDRFHFTHLFIFHSLFMTCHASLEVGVIYLGNLTEYAQMDELYDNVFHPYIQSPISVVPVTDPKLAKENKGITLEGDVPSSINPAPGCPFRGRCRYTEDVCSQARPELEAVNGKHKVACYLSDQANETRLT